MLKIILPYFSFRYDVDFLLTKQAILHIDIWRWAFYIHICTSLFVLFFGIFQFVKPLLNKFPSLHRMLGKAYILLILVFSAPSGLVMAFYANGGIWAKISFIIISVLWWVFTYAAYVKIINKNIEDHISFMIRSYALTLTAISLRTYVVILPFFVHLHGKEMYVLVAWLSWIPNLLIAEGLIRTRVFK
jgi:hypothetical protein